MRRSRHFTLKHCFAALVLAPSLSGAAELGDLKLASFVGQPLEAEIEMVALTAQDDTSLAVRLASPDVYRGANITMNPALQTLKLTLVRRDGRQFLHLTSVKPIDTDYLHLFLVLDAGSRSDVRSVTAWLSASPRPAAAAAPPATVVTSVVGPATAGLPLPAPVRPITASASGPAVTPTTASAPANEAASSAAARPVAANAAALPVAASAQPTAATNGRPASAAAPTSAIAEAGAAAPATKTAAQVMSNDHPASPKPAAVPATLAATAPHAQPTAGLAELSGKAASAGKASAPRALPAPAHYDDASSERPSAVQRDNSRLAKKLAELEKKLRALQLVVSRVAKAPAEEHPGAEPAKPVASKSQTVPEGDKHEDNLDKKQEGVHADAHADKNADKSADAHADKPAAGVAEKQDQQLAVPAAPVVRKVLPKPVVKHAPVPLKAKTRKNATGDKKASTGMSLAAMVGIGASLLALAGAAAYLLRRRKNRSASGLEQPATSSALLRNPFRRRRKTDRPADAVEPSVSGETVTQEAHVTQVTQVAQEAG